MILCVGLNDVQSDLMKTIRENRVLVKPGLTINIIDKNIESQKKLADCTNIKLKTMKQ